MRCCFLALAFFTLPCAFGEAAAARPATSGELVLLQEAMKKSAQEPERWAYTETRTMKLSKGTAKGETITRFDPSLPYAEQFTPIKIDGKEPTEKQRESYRKRGENRGKQVAKAAEAVRGNPLPPPPTLRLSGNRIALDPMRASLFREEETRLVFEIPVSGESKDIPLDRFQILVSVSKAERLVENIHVKVIDSFRVKLIAKVKAGEADFDFKVVDPKYGPLLAKMAGDLDVSVVFIPVNGAFLDERTDFKRVKPYDERFEVKVGPLKALDF